MKIISLEAENIKRLKAARIEPKGNTVIIGGNNNEGKTSLIDSIVMALGNKKLIDKSLQAKEPVNREAEGKGRIVVDLGELVITRTITKSGGGQLVVANRDGARFQSPQGILDQFYSNFTFDPLSFSRMDRNKRVEAMKSVTGLDFSEQDTKRKQLYDERAGINRDIRKLQGDIEDLPYHPDAPEEKRPKEELTRQLEEINQHNNANIQKRNQLTTTTNKVAAQEKAVAQKNQRVEELKKQLAEAEQQRDSATESLQQMEHDRDRLADEVNGLQDREPAEILARMEELDATNEKVAANNTYKAKQAELASLKQDAQQLTDQMGAIDRQKAEALAATQMPIAGLWFSEDDVLFEDTPFDDLSTSAKLRVSVAMGFAMNPKLKVLLVRDGSLLDEQNLALISKMAEEADGQVWIERVGKGRECQVIIEDGRVEDRPAEPDLLAEAEATAPAAAPGDDLEKF